MKKIGLIAGAFKPIQKGHYLLIETASRECDFVEVYVSLDDRVRKGELKIFGEDMRFVWETYIKPTLSSNVEVIYTRGAPSPIQKVLEKLIEEESRDERDITYMIYGDLSDLGSTFTTDKLNKYFPKLYSRGQIVLKTIDRANTNMISGTRMREFVSIGDLNSFIENLPKPIQSYGEDIFNLLKIDARG